MLEAEVLESVESASEVTEATESMSGIPHELPEDLETGFDEAPLTENVELAEDLSEGLEDYINGQRDGERVSLAEDLGAGESAEGAFQGETANETLSDNADGVSNDLPRCPPENCDYGYYDGERGNSDFYPNSEYVPAEKIGNTKSNPDGLNMQEIFDKYDVEKIPFNDGYPDFSDVSKATVEIDNFSENRYGPDGNFSQAYEKIAEERGCTQREVKDWIKENNYTLHECEDCKTIQKVPNEIHANIRHDGGVHVAKEEAE